MKLISKRIVIFDSVFILVVCMMCLEYLCVQCQLLRGREDSEAEMDEETLPGDHYSFVALIDIVFTNGAKNTCTGTIIHDNVAITAAHCFNVENDDGIQPEMTASFVVIGTKKMFDSGYEQYLPIERIIIHPKYKGWTADLALVFTFAGMMSDKPGQVIPLATETSSTPVDSDVIVFSWGKCIVDAPKLSEEKKPENNERLKQRKKKQKRVRLKKNRKKVRSERKLVTKSRSRITWMSVANKLKQPMSSIEENNRYPQQQLYDNLTDFNSEAEQKSWENKLEKLNQLYERSEVNKERMIQRERRQTSRSLSYYRQSGWRRKMGDQQNKLTIEVFGFVNMHACVKLVQKAMPLIYRIRNRNEILCYASERRFITKEDAGAPAMRRGRLVAVTVGSADFEGEHVTVGMKMVCFCNWIAENLPKGSRLQCCKNCCDLHDEEADKNKPSRHSHKKRKL